MSNALEDYYTALERLKKRKEKINNDAVAIEAGRKKGSIKKSREAFRELITAIDAAATEQSQQGNETREQLNRTKQSVKHFKEQLDAALSRELSLLHEVYNLKKQLAHLIGGNVLPIRTRKSPTS